MKTIAFFNIKGGAGKTTSVTTVSHMLASKGYKVLLVDIDPQASSTSTYHEIDFYEAFYRPTERLDYSTKTLLTDITVDVHKCIRQTEYENLDIIPADFTLIEAEREIVLDESAPQQNRLKIHLKKIESEYDFCIIDCGANAGLININALVAADDVIVPTTVDAYSLLSTKYTLEMIESVSEFNIKLNPIGLLYTRWEKKQSNRISNELLDEKYQDLVLPIKIRKSKECEEISFVRKPLLEYDSGKNKCNATLDYLKLTAFICAPNRNAFLKKVTPLMELEEQQKALLNQKARKKNKVKNAKEMKTLEAQIEKITEEVERLRRELL